MNEKEFNNTFRFSLTQEDVLLCEKIFNADSFNPFTRYSINIRDVLPRIITKLQKTLSKYSYDVIADVGRIDTTNDDSDVMIYDLSEYHQEIIKQYNPQPIIQQIEDKTIRGVECKIGLYINDKPIVERLFYVDGFNPIARWSIELVETVVEITDSIYEKIKKNDVKNMWDDYDLINYRGLSISQIRELSVFEREVMLKKLRN
jgi:hypothetical protein